MTSSKPKALVIRAAGINCEIETGFAFQQAGAEVQTEHVGRLLSDRSLIDQFKILAIPGGFSYGDDLGGGKVLASELKFRLADAISNFVDRGGLVLGICNGFQVLVKLGLLPGLEQTLGRQDVTLTDNDSNQYEDRWVRLRANTSANSPFLEPSEDFYLPVAHAEGKLVADESTQQKILEGHRDALHYVGIDGSEDPEYPDNPNGSVQNIAGLIDSTGRVFGLMPHPERFLFAYNHPYWRRLDIDPMSQGDGARLFSRAVAFVT